MILGIALVFLAFSPAFYSVYKKFQEQRLYTSWSTFKQQEDLFNFTKSLEAYK